MHRRHVAMALYFIGAATMVVSVVAAQWIQPEFEIIGMREYNARYGAAGFMVFAFAFPLGVAAASAGALLLSERRRARLAVFILLSFAAGTAAVAAPMLFGHQQSPLFFGAGGVAILILVAMAIRYWGEHRSRLAKSARGSADLQGAGYVCFALAAWNLCGVGGMPSFLIYPQQALAFGTEGFAVGQMKTVMALLVAGWLLTALSFFRAVRSR
ncbi:MAG: hypothetical protein JSW10_02275 [Pseudomonadota bacterium]|nr:MAG: hypothetical protein JSW10_02275 [Pseudomonadota bacterium]